MPSAPRIFNQRIVAKTKLFTVEEMQLTFSNETTVTYERLVSPSRGAVLIVPFLNDDTLLLIREYCAGVQRYELAFPKGRVEQGESIEHSANRELMEEVGYAANSLQFIKSVSIAPGSISHRTHIVVATDLYEKKLAGDEPEPIEVVEWSTGNLEQLLAHDEFTEARSIAALHYGINLVHQKSK